MIRERTICAHTVSAHTVSVRRILVALFAAIALGACSVPDDDSVRIIEHVPLNLGDPAPTTTTTPSTTTTTPTTTKPVVIVATLPTTTLPPVTLGPPSPTTPPIVPDPVHLYFVVGDAMAEVTRVLTIQPELQDLAGLLSFGPLATEAQLGSRTAIEVDDVSGIALLAGTLTVDLASKFRDLPSSEQRRAIAQLVLTYTKRGGVGQVKFTSGGREFEVPRADGSFGAATVSRDDYATLVLPPIDLTGISTTTSAIPR